jgi:hypothetical protein
MIMAGSLGLSSAIHVFMCPNCKETINTSDSQCPFCSTCIDHDQAQAAAELMAKINQACSDGSYLKIMAGMLLIFFLLRYVPFLGLIGSAGFYFLLIAVPVMAIRWWIKFGAIRTRDSGFRTARFAVIASGAFAVVIGGVVATILTITWRN